MSTEKSTLVLPVENMDSEHCALIVDEALGTVASVGAHHVELNNRSAVIEMGASTSPDTRPAWTAPRSTPTSQRSSRSMYAPTVPTDHVAGVLMALLRRTQTGQGDYIDISMQDSLVSWLVNVVGPVFAEDRDLVLANERGFGGNAFYNLYRCADGRHISLGGSEVKFAANLLTALGRPDLIDLCKLPPGPGQDHRADTGPPGDGVVDE